MASTWSRRELYTEANTGATRTYGTNNNDMGITAVGNINKTPGLGLTKVVMTMMPYATYLKLFSGEMIKVRVCLYR